MGKVSPLAAASPINYPDILGALTEGQRVTMDTLQIAVAIKPGSVAAGHPAEAIILMQNMINGPVDALVQLATPDKDLAGKGGRFINKFAKPIRIGLRAGEVGYATMPFLVAHQAQPGTGYRAEINIQVETKARGAAVRDASGGAELTSFAVEDVRLALFESLARLDFSVEVTTRGGLKPGANKGTLAAPFTVLPPTVTGLPPELKPGYQTLWTEADFVDEQSLLKKAKPIEDRVMHVLNRAEVFFPLLKANQEMFEAAGFRMWAGEAVCMTKLMCTVLEMGAPITVAGRDTPTYPSWYVRLCNAVVDDPTLATPSRVGEIVTETIYHDLVTDAAHLGFSMLGTVTSDDFGTPDEIRDYTSSIVSALRGQGGLDLGRAYLPLILAGLVVNSRVVMPQEYPSETLLLFERALIDRAQTANQSSEVIFAIAEQLIERAANS